MVAADVVAHRVGGEQELDRGDAAAAVGARHELLQDDGVEGEGELLADLRLLARREDVDDAVDCLRRVVGVQRRQHQVAGLRRGQRRRHGLQVAHLPHQQDVGVLAQRRPQRLREGAGVAPHLDVLDHRPARPVLVLDRVLDGEDVAGAGAVELADEAAARAHQLGEGGRQVQAGERRDLERQGADRRRELPPLAVQVDAEAPRRAAPLVELAPGGEAQGEVRRAALVEVAARPAAQVGAEHARQLVAVHRG